MSHVANQRIKKGGEYFAPGDKITLTEDDLKDLPKGAVRADDGSSETSEPAEPVALDEAQQALLKDAVAKLKPTAFKRDGEIRAGALKGLNDQLDFTVSVEAVAAAQAAGEE